MSTLGSIGRNNYRYYKKSIDTLSNSSKRLSSGKKLASIDSNSVISIGNSRYADARANTALGDACYHTVRAVIGIQESVAAQANDIATRLYELAAMSQDASLSDANRMSLQQEHWSLALRASDLALSTPNVGTLTPELAVTVNTHLDNGTPGTLAINFNETFNADAYNLANFVTCVCSAATQLTTSAGGVVMLAQFARTSGVDLSANPLLAASAFAAKTSKNLSSANFLQEVQMARSAAFETQAEEYMGIDAVEESAEFSKASVQLNTAQIMQSQANNLLSTVNRFLQNL